MEDREILQSDLTKLQDWSNRWFLKFHPDKCKTMSISTPQKVPFDTVNHMTKTEDNITSEIRLEKVQQEKDLGVITDQHLTFEEHLTMKANKANQTRIVCIRPKGRTQCIFPRSQHSCLYIYILIPSLAMTTMCIFLYSVNIGN